MPMIGGEWFVGAIVGAHDQRGRAPGLKRSCDRSQNAIARRRVPVMETMSMLLHDPPPDLTHGRVLVGKAGVASGAAVGLGHSAGVAFPDLPMLRPWDAQHFKLVSSR